MSESSDSSALLVSLEEESALTALESQSQSELHQLELHQLEPHQSELPLAHDHMAPALSTHLTQSSLALEVQYKVQEAAQTLKDGGVVVCPTEGVYGISAMVTNSAALMRVLNLKKRALNKGLIVVAADVAMLEGVVNFAALSSASQALLHEKWPGHATFIVPTVTQLNPILTGGRNTLAVRITAFPLLQALCREVGTPLISTSANISGCEPLKTLEEIHATFASKVDYILDEPCQGLHKPSTIYDAVSGAILRV